MLVVTAVRPAGAVTLTAFVSALVDLIVAVATPIALVTAAGCTIVLPVPVEATVTVWPATTLPCASLRVIVKVESDEPSAVNEIGLPEIVEVLGSGAPAVKVTAL